MTTNKEITPEVRANLETVVDATINVDAEATNQALSAIVVAKVKQIVMDWQANKK